MSRPDLLHCASEAAEAILLAAPEPPTIAIALGSGLGALADRLADTRVILYDQIPYFPHPTIAGHDGQLIIGALGEARVLILRGRLHYYEGHGLGAVTFPIRVLQRLGIRTLILTAATGGILESLGPGDLVCLSDHLNLIGSNPLRGPNDDRLGLRFPDMTEVYSSRLRRMAQTEAERLGFTLKSGVYACLPGPSYETPAEVRMLRMLGADVVGMSTAPEAIVARHAGMEVLALALVSNMAAGVTGKPILHEEVLEAGRRSTPLLGALIEAIVRRLS